uniref:Uncharacterized protein n=1 Tax=Arundo donax TaxID=35708 RepID=A0A0A9FAW0_ARUDO
MLSIDIFQFTPRTSYGEFASAPSIRVTSSNRSASFADAASATTAGGGGPMSKSSSTSSSASRHLRASVISAAAATNSRDGIAGPITLLLGGSSSASTKFGPLEVISSLFCTSKLDDDNSSLFGDTEFSFLLSASLQLADNNGPTISSVGTFFGGNT